MKKIIPNLMLAGSFLILICIVNSCTKEEDVIDNVTVPFPYSVSASLETNIPLATVDTVNFVTYPDIPLNLDLAANIKEKFPDLTIDNLKSVKLQSLTMTYVSSQDSTTLGVIKNAEMYIKTPTSDVKLIGTTDNNTNETVITFTPQTTDNELLEYLKSNQNSFVLKMQGSEVAADLIKMKIDASFQLQVGL